MHGSEMAPSVSQGIGWFFVMIFAINLGYVSWLFRTRERTVGQMILPAIWLVYVLFLAGTSIEFLQGHGPNLLGEDFRDFVDGLMDPTVYFLLSSVLFTVMLIFRRFFVKPFVAFLLLNVSLLLMGFSMVDPDFREIVGKADNVPITLLIFSVGFTTWIAMYQAVENDDRIAAGKKPLEADGADKVLTWPDLVYTEMLAIIVGTAFLLAWAILFKAPLEPPASTTEIPNPSKAPWYFLGLQEMLVYFDPWLAGVVLPTYIIIGLCALPYLDYNQKGNGYYTFNERPLAITTFLVGFLLLWVVLIVLGTILRGPNWNFYGPYEYWSPYKTEALNNIDLSEYLWIDLLGSLRPDNILIRESVGLLLVLAYFFALPLIMAKMMRGMVVKMGLIRFFLFAHIMLMMAFLPVKMVLRWVFNLKYIVAIPEYFFNI